MKWFLVVSFYYMSSAYCVGINIKTNSHRNKKIKSQFTKTLYQVLPSSYHICFALQYFFIYCYVICNGKFSDNIYFSGLLNTFISVEYVDCYFKRFPFNFPRITFFVLYECDYAKKSSIVCLSRNNCYLNLRVNAPEQICCKFH